MTEIFRAMEVIVKKELSCSAHDLEHVYRVINLCKILTQNERNVNWEILSIAALMHDIARVYEDKDPTGQTDHAILGAQKAADYLQETELSPDTIGAIRHCIESHRYRSGLAPQTIEGKILFDADKLDVIGAIGIARSFALTGQYGEPFYAEVDLEQYIKTNLVGGSPEGRVKDIHQHTANIEFELKLRHIPQRLYTQKAKAIANERIAFMTAFFDRLRQEIHGTS
jgi:uncharacterized protein